MGVDDLYQLWLANGHDELAERVSRTQQDYDRLVHKDSTYGRSIKAILDLRIQMLAVWDAPPAAVPPGYVIVPVEPTEAMIAAMCNGYANGFLIVGGKTVADGIRLGYAQLLAAAPKQGDTK